MNIGIFPEVNASLNGLTTLLLVSGWLFISRGNQRAHIACMIGALCTSTAFLASYLTYHSLVGSVKFTADGPVRGVYFAILVSHTVLAMLVVPMVAATVIPAIRRRWQRHKRIARWTLPVWLYVSITGVLVYFMLYQWFPSDHLAELGR